jgi:hypothetical protein
MLAVAVWFAFLMSLSPFGGEKSLTSLPTPPPSTDDASAVSNPRCTALLFFVHTDSSVVTPNHSLCVTSFAVRAIIPPISVRQNTTPTQCFADNYFILSETATTVFPAVAYPLFYSQAHVFIAPFHRFVVRALSSHRHSPLLQSYSPTSL